MNDLTTKDNDSNSVYARMKPMNISRCNDMVAYQKELNSGGAFKVKSLFCCCCPAASDEYVLPNNAPCENIVNIEILIGDTIIKHSLILPM